MELPYGETVTVLRKGQRDKFGDHAGDSTYTVTNCAFSFEGPTRTQVLEIETDHRETQRRRADFYAPSNCGILFTDRVKRADGSVFHVLGKGLWDGDVHPMNGWQPGYRVYHVEEIT